MSESESSDKYTEEDELPTDGSSVDDDEVVDAREKVRNARGWRSVALLNESDSEKDDDPDKFGVSSSDEDMVAQPGSDDEERAESEYMDSSDPGSYEGHCGDDAIAKKSRHPIFKDIKGIPKFEVGMLFKSNTQFKNAVSNYGILSRHEIKFVRNEPARCRAKCVGSTDCPWLIFASYNREVDSFQVKTYYSEHTCEAKRELKRLTSKYLAKKFHRLISGQPDIKAKTLKALIQESMELEVTINQCRKVRRMVLAEMAGYYKKEFEKLRDYAEEILVSNPGSTVSLLTHRVNESDHATFKAFYCCFKSCKEGLLAGCRPVLGLDGCFLKGLLKGELLAAVGRDGNNQMFPVAWAIVEVENTDSWTWFLDLLRHDVRTAHGEGWTLISDRQKV